MRLILLLLLGACAGRGLDDARTWAVQLQGLDRPGAATALERSGYDVIVIEPMRSIKGRQTYPVGHLVRQLRRRHVVLAYLNVGQAEDYRTYWADWAVGEPSFVLGVDPDGWAGNYPVSFWDARWRKILLAQVDALVADGFDGAMCDWVFGIENALVVAAAKRDGVDPAREMAHLLRALHERAPGFLLLAQNGAPLLDAVPEAAAWIDGLTQESLTWAGQPGAKWKDTASGDREPPWDRTEIWASLRAWRERGMPVFTLDYARQQEHVAEAERASRAAGFVPFVSRITLDRLP